MDIENRMRPIPDKPETPFQQAMTKHYANPAFIGHILDVRKETVNHWCSGKRIASDEVLKEMDVLNEMLDELIADFDLYRLAKKSVDTTGDMP